MTLLNEILNDAKKASYKQVAISLKVSPVLRDEIYKIASESGVSANILISTALEQIFLKSK